MIGISYLLFTHNEVPQYINALFSKLIKLINPAEDEIILVDDNSDNQDTLEALKTYNGYATFYRHSLDGDFAAHKNFGKSKCTKPYICQLDADEIPHDALIQTLKETLLLNPTVDLFRVPRVNIVVGLTPEHTSKWGWRVNEKGWVNFPDYQDRIFKNIPEIHWENKVHERITGNSSHAELPAVEEYALLHVKDIIRQQKQNEFYSTL